MQLQYLFAFGISTSIIPHFLNSLSVSLCISVTVSPLLLSIRKDKGAIIQDSTRTNQKLSNNKDELYFNYFDQYKLQQIIIIIIIILEIFVQ